MTDLPVTIADIRHAAKAIAGAVAPTPLIRAAALCELTGCEVYLKLETLHPTGAFKERGALNKLLSLGPQERRTGVVAMSAGNHAQGVAYHARRLGIPATIVMPQGTPFTKIDRTEALGAKVVLKGSGLVEARYGSQVSRWRWGAAHRAEMRHRLFSYLPLVSGFGSLSIEADGDGRTVNKAEMYVRDTRSPYAARHGAGYRAIYTLADLDASRFILSTGPAGHPLSRFYDNMLQDWRDIRYVRFARDRAEAERGAAGVIDLKPLR